MNVYNSIIKSKSIFALPTTLLYLITLQLFQLEEKESEKSDTRTQSLDRSFSREAPTRDLEVSVRLRDRKDSLVDQMFCQSLREFKTNLVSTYSVAFQKESNLALKYKDLIKNFEQVGSVFWSYYYFSIMDRRTDN